MNKFCTNCGHPVKPTDNVCGNCGQPIQSTSKVAPASAMTNKPRVKKKMSKGKKIFYSVVVIVIVILGAGVISGFNYYSKENQAARIINALTDGSPSLEKYVITDNKKVRITSETLKPLQAYYQYFNTKSAKKQGKDMLLDSLKHPNSKATLQLVKNGNYFMIFPKYSLRVRTYSPVISTDDDQDHLYIDNTYMGKIKSDKKKKADLLPGTYNINIYDKDKYTTSRMVDVMNNDPIFIDIKTYKVKIKGPAYSKMYFNGVHEKDAILDKSGEAFRTFYKGGKQSATVATKKYDPDKDGEFYLTTTVDGKTVKSKPIKGLINQLDDFNTYGANSDSGIIKWSNSDDYDYVVTPKWDADVDIKN